MHTSRGKKCICSTASFLCSHMWDSIERTLGRSGMTFFLCFIFHYYYDLLLFKASLISISNMEDSLTYYSTYY